MDLYQELRDLIDAIEASEIPYAVCGGIAVVLHGHARLTKDIDMLIRGEDLDAVRGVIKPLGFELEAGVMPFGVGTPAEREIFRISKVVGEQVLPLDLLLVSTAYETVWDSRESFDWGDRKIWVVSLDGLATMKRMSGRHQDLADLENLGIGGDDA